MKIGTKVQTPHGPGTIKIVEVHRKFNRYGVVHDTPNDQFRNGQEAYYFKEEIQKISCGNHIQQEQWNA